MNVYENFGKRFFDFVFSSLALLLCLPLFLLLAIFIKLDSNGPVFFVQKRMGLNGELFRLIKFRTMYRDITKEGPSFEPGAINRITPLGKILRHTKLDELPQLINISIGDMSFVGPRPETPDYKSFYSNEYKKILSIKPGITSEASIKYRNEEKILAQSHQPEKIYKNVILPDKLKISLKYVEDGLSLQKDIKIIFNTLKNFYS